MMGKQEWNPKTAASMKWLDYCEKLNGGPLMPFQRQLIEDLRKLEEKNFKDIAYSVTKWTIHIICEKDNGDQVRTHKKKRINKKWRKRYGLVSAPLEKGQIITLTTGHELLMSRKTYRTLKQRLHWKESR